MLQVELHPILRYSHHNVAPGHCCSVIWDLHNPPASSVRPVGAPDIVLTPHELSQPATTPTITTLHVTCGYFPEDWPITAQNNDGVTIGNVLQAIFDCLQQPITWQEWDRMRKKHQDRINRVFDSRWRTSEDPPTARERGILRIDCLIHHSWFGGLSVSLETEESCILSLRYPR